MGSPPSLVPHVPPSAENRETICSGPSMMEPVDLEKTMKLKFVTCTTCVLPTDRFVSGVDPGPVAPSKFRATLVLELIETAAVDCTAESLAAADTGGFETTKE